MVDFTPLMRHAGLTDEDIKREAASRVALVRDTLALRHGRQGALFGAALSALLRGLIATRVGRYLLELLALDAHVQGWSCGWATGYRRGFAEAQEQMLAELDAMRRPTGGRPGPVN